MAYLTPLLFTIGSGMLREMLSDFKRWRSDRRNNNVKYKRVSNSNFEQIEEVSSDKLRVGDIIELTDDQLVPADCFLLYT
jgi:P-type E1-E2 ATPase